MAGPKWGYAQRKQKRVKGRKAFQLRMHVFFKNIFKTLSNVLITQNISLL